MKKLALLAVLAACTADPPPDTTVDAGTDGGAASECEAFQRTTVTTSQRTVTTEWRAHFRDPGGAAAIRLCGRVNLGTDAPGCPPGAQCSGSWPEPPTCVVVSNYEIVSDGRARAYCGTTYEVFDTGGALIESTGVRFTSVEVR